jgi:hypothetical protein
MLTITEDTQRIEQRKAGWLFAWVDSLVYSRWMLYLPATAGVVYYAYPAWRRWRVRRRNARTVRDAYDAERRRWDGHRRETNRKDDRSDPGPTGTSRK